MGATPSQFAGRVEEFEVLVTKHFAFLAEDHGFTAGALRLRDVDSTLDAEASIAFHREDLRVTVGLGLAANLGLGVVIRDNDWPNKPAPQDGSRRPKTVHFEYLVEFLTGGAERPMLPHHGHGPVRDHAVTQRRIEEHLEPVLLELAAKLRAHAALVLDGDVTSRFGEADAFYQRKIGG